MGTARRRKDMKVLHLIDSGGLYGAEKMLLALCVEQIKQGICPVILSCGKPSEGPKSIEVEARKLDIEVIPWRMKPGLNLRGIRDICQLASRELFSVLHSHSGKFNILLSMVTRKSCPIKRVITVHGNVRPPFYSRLWLTMILNFFCIQLACAKVFVSQGMTRAFPFNMMKQGSFDIIENGISLAPGSSVLDLAGLANPALAPENAFPVIAFIGRLSKEKGCNYLLSAFENVKAKYPSAHLLFCGDGYMRESLEKQVAERNMCKSVSFLGFVEDVTPIFELLDVFVLPSLTEGMPIVLLEAMRRGKVIVSTDVGGIPSMLEGGEAGYLVPAKDSKAIEFSITRALTEKAESCKKSLYAAKIFETRYTSSKMASKYISLYADLIGSTETNS